VFSPFGIAKVRRFSNPANFFAKIFKKVADFLFSATFYVFRGRFRTLSGTSGRSRNSCGGHGPAT